VVRELRRIRRIKSYRAPRTPVRQAAVRVKRPAGQPRFLAVSLRRQELAALEERAAPATQVQGTLPERILYKALLKRRIEFDFQSSLGGGRIGWMFGRQVADFALHPRGIIIEVQGAYWHSQREQRFRDQARDMVLTARGWTVLYLGEDVIYNETLLNRWLDSNILFGRVGSTGWLATSAIVEA